MRDKILQTVNAATTSALDWKKNETTYNRQIKMIEDIMRSVQNPDVQLSRAAALLYRQVQSNPDPFEQGFTLSGLIRVWEEANAEIYGAPGKLSNEWQISYRTPGLVIVRAMREHNDGERAAIAAQFPGERVKIIVRR